MPLPCVMPRWLRAKRIKAIMTSMAIITIAEVMPSEKIKYIALVVIPVKTASIEIEMAIMAVMPLGNFKILKITSKTTANIIMKIRINTINSYFVAVNML